jgi:ribonuclease-3
VRHPEAAAHRVPELRDVRQASGARRLTEHPAPSSASEDLSTLVASLGLSAEPAALRLATVHRSYSYENGRIPTNERLEFLGDSVLGLVVTDFLYRSHPDLSEGHLAKMRSAIVNARSLAVIAAKLDIGTYLLLGRGEQTTGGRKKVSILADAMEAVIGAVYLENGLEGAREFILRQFGDLIESVSHLGAGLDWKTSLQERVARLGIGPAEYIVEGHGPDHARVFTAYVKLADGVYDKGRGHTKKEAEQLAAEAAFKALRDRTDP